MGTSVIDHALLARRAAQLRRERRRGEFLVVDQDAEERLVRRDAW